MHTRVMVVCLCGCVRVCMYVTIYWLFKKFLQQTEIPIDFMLLSKRFQLRDFSIKLWFKSYSFNRTCQREQLAIESIATLQHFVYNNNMFTLSCKISL